MTTDEWLTADEHRRLRQAIETAVLATPAGLKSALDDDPRAYLRLVVSSRTAAEETSRLLRDSIDGARRAGHSWDSLGRVLGVSRQAAQQRFGSPSEAAANSLASGGRRARRVLSPLTAFDEMAVLRDEGRRGWHVVDYGTLHHVVEASDSQWEHRRVVGSFGARHERLVEQGWQLIKTARFPWAYYKRRLDAPADADHNS